MKNTSIIALAAIALVGCGPKEQRTVLTGSFKGENVPEEVRIVMGSHEIDTTLKVENAAFSINLPVDKLALINLKAGALDENLISDGTKLALVIDEEGKLSLTSSHPKSLAVKYQEYKEWSENLSKEYSAKAKEIMEGASEKKDSLMDNLYDATVRELSEKGEKTVLENKDNVLAVEALKDVKDLFETNKLDTLVNGLDTTLAKNTFVEKLKKLISVKKETAEGQSFADFSVEQSDGKVAKLSDYVGKGKYVLVDFWASWCGPCRREIPNLKNVYDKYHGKEFEILGVAVWDKPEETMKAIKEEGMKWPQIIDAQRIPTDIYGIEGIPHIILFGPDGTILKRGLRGEKIGAEVAEYVKPVK